MVLYCRRLPRRKELAAFGVVWNAILLTVAMGYYLFARRYGIQLQ